MAEMCRSLHLSLCQQLERVKFPLPLAHSARYTSATTLVVVGAILDVCARVAVLFMAAGSLLGMSVCARDFSRYR